jgi:hypothetical protein
MIHDVDESLRELTKRDVLNGAKVEISFEAPNKDWSSRRNAPALNLYLYDVREDLTRRQVQFEEHRDANGFVTDRRTPPRMYKLSYLVTAWTQRPEDEHRLLSAVISCFIRFDALPKEILQGDLAQQAFPLRVTVGLPLPADRSISDVWNALGGELKPSVDLVVTAPFSANRHFTIGPPVLEVPKITIIGREDGQQETRGGKPARRVVESATPVEGPNGGPAGGIPSRSK